MRWDGDEQHQFVTALSQRYFKDIHFQTENILLIVIKNNTVHCQIHCISTALLFCQKRQVNNPQSLSTLLNLFLLSQSRLLLCL